MENTDKLKKSSLSQLNFTNRFYDLSADFYQYQLPTDIKFPFLIHLNPIMAKELDMDSELINYNELTGFSCGNTLLEKSEPIACIYAGHQFGQFVPQLGDGRAIMLGEVKNESN